MGARFRDDRRPAALRRVIFGSLGLRPAYIEHTRAEDDLLRSWATGRRNVVELGVAEGGGAAALRGTMDPAGTLTLVDPYFAGRLGVSFARITARRLVRRHGSAAVRWFRALSWDAAETWTGGPVDLLFIDGDHSYDAILRDFSSWEPHLAPGATVALHDTNPCEWIAADSPQVAALAAILDRAPWRVVAVCDSMTVLTRES